MLWWLQIRSFEKSTRIYQWIGIAAIDDFAARRFGDDPIKPYREGMQQSFNRIRDAYYKGQYSEVVNIMSCLIYITMMAGFLYWNVDWAAWWTLAIMSVHAVCIPIERYKRACMLQWLDHPEALTAPDPPLPPRRGPKQLLHPVFKPRRFESEAFYDKVWVDSFRNFVMWLASLSIKMPGDHQSVHNTLKTRDLDYLDAFERQTRVGETIHFIGILQHVPFWALIPSTRAWPVLLFALWPLYLNVYALFLQRQHRARIFRLLLKAANRRENAAEAAAS